MENHENQPWNNEQHAQQQEKMKDQYGSMLPIKKLETNLALGGHQSK